MPVPLIQEDTGDMWNTNAGDYLPSTTWDSTVAAANLAANNTSLGIAGDLYLKNKFEQAPLQKTLSIPELNEKYMGQGITWTSPQKEVVADMIAQQHARLNQWRNRAATGNGLLNTATGLLVGAGDPAMMVGGMVVGTAMRAGGVLPQILAGEGLAASVGRGAIEGAAVMAPLEAGIVARDRAYQNDVSMTESLKNIAMGAAFGATAEGLRFAARELPGYVKSASDKWLARNTKAEDNVRFTEMAAQQMAEGKRPMLEPIAEHLRRERGGSEALPYEYQPIDSSVPVTKEFYLGTQSQAEQLHVAAPDSRNSSTDFGPGLYGSDHLAAENGYAASSLHDSPGLIHRFETQNAKLFDVERPLDEGTANIFAGEAERLGEKQLAKDLRSGDVNLRQAYEQLGSEKAAALNQKISEMGYDGLHFTEGAKGAERNGVMMFPDKADGVRVTGEPYSANSEVKGGLSDGEARAAMDAYAAPENDVFHSKEEQEAFQAQKERLASYDAEDPMMIDDARASVEMQLKQLDGKGLLSEEAKAKLQEMLGTSNKGDAPSLKDQKKLGEGVLKEMTACIVEH